MVLVPKTRLAHPLPIARMPEPPGTRWIERFLLEVAQKRDGIALDIAAKALRTGLVIDGKPKERHRDGSWESIRRHGLLSTSALLDLYGMDGDRRLALEAQRRLNSVLISGEGLPNTVIRDQKPMTESALAKCLVGGMTTEEWFRLLNERVFFWLSRARLRRLLSARAYRGRPQTVLTLDTASLVAAHCPRIELSPINSGATIYNPQPRGRDTFLPIADYPFDERRKRRTSVNSVVELVVRDGTRGRSCTMQVAVRWA
jgi:hypothetical protein